MWKSMSEVPKEILDRYVAGDYWFKPPDVYTGSWGDLAWINYLFGNGRNAK